MTTRSPNQEGVEGTVCEEVWMITGESVILFTYASFVRNPFILPHQEGIFLGWLARDYPSLRNSWERVSFSSSRRKIVNRPLISSASDFGPMNARPKSSAYLM